MNSDLFLELAIIALVLANASLITMFVMFATTAGIL